MHDNPALNWVCQNSKSVLPVYIHSADEEQPWVPGAASRWWLQHSLEALDEQLKAFDLKLHYFSGPSEKVIKNIIQQTNSDTLVFNNLYDPHLLIRDRELTQRLNKKINVHAFDTGLFFIPGSILNNQQQPYRVFTPFYKKARPLLDLAYTPHSGSLDKTTFRKLSMANINFTVPLSFLNLLDSNNWYQKLHQYWQPGEQNALLLLDQFIDQVVYKYDETRDIPSSDATSKISAALHFGELTPQQVYFSLKPLLDGVFNSIDMASAELFLKQLLWREFGHHILWHYPNTTTKAINSRYKNNFWKKNKKALNAWQKGETGVPIVDAGMKQLWETGWMHNRVRMVASSFLTKNLGIHWLEGARWFWDTLVDADLANNTMGWQWVAGCGVDAAPYYRIFNPLTQAKRFDTKNKYIERWLPGFNESEYRKPIIDISQSRVQALERYKKFIRA